GATLQDYAMAKAKTYVRIKGASDPSSSFHELYIRQLHDAGKAGIRAAMAVMVANSYHNQDLLDVTKSEYQTGACLDVPSENPDTWQPQACTSFEHYIASMVAREFDADFRRMSRSYFPFFYNQDVLDIQRFYRVKADLESIPSELEADRFIVTVKQFIDRVRAKTEPIYNLTIAADPQVGLRLSNMSAAVLERDKKLTKSVLHVVPRVSNTGFRDISNVKIAMYRVNDPRVGGNGILAKTLPPPRVDLPASSERFLRDDADLAGNPEDDVTGNQANLLDQKRL